MAFQIIFENTLDKAVELQVQAGNMACGSNPTIVDEQIASGATKQINTNQNVVCYRRTADPDNPGTFTEFVEFDPNEINTPVTIDIGLI